MPRSRAPSRFVALAAAGLLASVGASCGGVDRDPPGPAPGGGWGSMPGGGGSGKAPATASGALPLSGGTLTSIAPGLAVAADPEHDTLWVLRPSASYGGGSVRRQIALQAGDEPGRVVAGAAGRAHVLARRGGVVIAVDPATGEVLSRRQVCPAPRGIAYDAERGELHVACLHGELVTLPEAGGAPTRILELGPDLRDVVADGARLLVSRFRAATIVVVATSGEVVQEIAVDSTSMGRVPSVMWRLAPRPGGGAIAVYQTAAVELPATAPVENGYDGGVTPAVVTEVVEIPPEYESITYVEHRHAPVVGLALPVDAVALPDGGIAIVGAGTGEVLVLGGDPVESDPCERLEPDSCQPVGVAWDEDAGLIVQHRSPAYAGGASLPADAIEDVGHTLFHVAPTGSVACASCHPEGGEDGLVWQFPEGPRRTQYLGGAVGETAPFHWSGDLSTMASLATVVFETRMGGGRLEPSELEALDAWVDGIPRLPSPEPRAELAEAVERGRALFEGDAGCVDCHAGPQRTSASSHDVGTGARFQAARLVDLAARGPFMHDGCAPTLRERFDPTCGGDAHGDVDALSTEDVDALVAYLETL